MYSQMYSVIRRGRSLETLRENLSDRIAESRMDRVRFHLYNIPIQHTKLRIEPDISPIIDALEQIKSLPFDNWSDILTPLLTDYWMQLDHSNEEQFTMTWVLQHALESILADEYDYWYDTDEISDLLREIKDVEKS